MLKDAKFGRRRAERKVTLDAFRADHDHFAGFNFAHKFSANDVERASFGAERVSIADFAQNQWSHAQWIAYADQFGARHGNDGKSAFDPAQGVFHTFGDVALQRACHQVDDAF